MKFETKAIHIGEEPNLGEGGSGDAVMAIHLCSTFARAFVDTPTQGYEYSRTSNPTRDAVEKRLAALENARYALAFSSGMAAETTLMMSLLKSGDHVVAFDDLYGGSKRLFNRILHEQFSIDFTYVDARNLEHIESALTEKTKVIWLETPTNPLLKLCDIQAISEMTKRYQIITVVDNTFLSPFFQNPLALGADIVVHSTTKYLNGHSDSVGGAVMLNHPAYFEKIKFAQNAIGAILSPFDSYLLLRGIKTLAVRMRQHQENAMIISDFLENNKKIKRVIYPGLQSYSQLDLAKKQMKGFGGMISFELKTDILGAKKFVEQLKIPLLAESLGGVESLIEVPSLMTHASIPKEEREKIGLSDSLIRFSVGLENIEDLLEDLKQGLNFLDVD